MAEVAELVEALSDPSFYPHDPDDIEVRESTTSVVFLAGDRAFKLKKPINHPDMNYSTPARRRRMCNLEVELCERLSPALYHGVHKITARKDGFALNGRGKVVDYVIEMNRLDDDNVLRVMVDEDRVDPDQIRALARKLAIFHDEAERRQLINSFSRPHIIARQWNRRFRASAEYVGPLFSADVYRDIVTFASYFLGENRSLLQSRIDNGFICDGHGELTTEHIYFEDGIQVIDCVEYNDRMRYRDVAFDLAALVLSLDSLGSPDLSDILVEEYKVQSGNALDDVLDFYLCFRAHDRALTLSRLANMPDVQLAEHQSLVKRAKRYYHLAHKYSRGARQPILLVMSGVIGVGKSRLASALAEILAVGHLSVAESGEDFAMIDDDADPETDKDAARVHAAYEDLFERAESQISRGRSVVLDAAFYNSTYRVAARTLARKHNAEFLVVECDADEDILRERVREQAEDSDERPRERLRMLREQQKAFRPSREIYRKDKVYVNTTDSLEEQVETVLAEL
ncbi:bifunctional aminoglycoside phosphotransferase/ATP-binding protein [soil metagenome]